MTTEQIIVLGLLAVAYAAGWIMGVVTARLRGRKRAPPFPAVDGVEKGTLIHERGPLPVSGPTTPLPEPIEESPPVAQATGGAERPASPAVVAREQLHRAIKAYHAAVALALSHANGNGREGEEALRALAHSLVALAGATRAASERLERGDPVAQTLRLSGPELVDVASDVMARSKEQALPATVLDRLEQDLAAAAAAILGPGPAAQTAA